MKKRIITAITACALAASMMIGGTFAYLTSNATKTNSFTVGNVKIELDETGYPGNDKEEVKNIVPNQEITKDPTIKNTGTNDAVVFAKVTVPKATIAAIDSNGKRQAAAKQELFALLNGSKDMRAITDKEDDWYLLQSTDGDDSKEYIFGYSKVLGQDITTSALFDKVKLANFAEAADIKDATQNIVVSAYAIQADMLDGGTIASKTAIATAELNKIYDIYMNQEGSSTGSSGTTTG